MVIDILDSLTDLERGNVVWQNLKGVLVGELSRVLFAESGYNFPELLVEEN